VRQSAANVGKLKRGETSVSLGCTLSLDAMGGDHAPGIVLEGVNLARRRHPSVKYLLFGDSGKLKPYLDKNPEVAALCTLHHTDVAITNEDKPSQAVRSGRESSMWKAIQAVKAGEAAGVVSAGNTGALMAMSKLTMRTLPGIDRPAICSMFPNMHGDTVMLDLGANAVCDVRNLVEFAVMGECFAKSMMEQGKPRIGLLNIGSEDRKGTDVLRDAAQVLRDSELDIEFHGFIEGDDIAMGTVDVVVTDGFTGNVALKTAEGTAKLYSHFLRNAFSSSFLAKFGLLFVRPVLSKVMMRTDPRRYNGALLVGLNGIAVKSHGGTDSLGFSNAIGVAIDMVTRDLNAQIAEELSHLSWDATQSQPLALSE